MESLFFIAIIPPESINQQITQFKLEIVEKFGSKHALKSPPHITLHMPFKWKEKKMDKLTGLIHQVNNQMHPFEIELKDFDFFEPRVVFVNVVPNEGLSTLQRQVVDLCRRQLNLDNADYKNRPFHPHITIGFRDLRKRMFYEAKNYYESKKVNFKFQAEEISLLKHDGKQWIKKL